MFRYSFKDEDVRVSMQTPSQQYDGYLIVEALKEDGSLLPGATVTIESEEPQFDAGTKVLKTGPEGQTEKTALPTPSIQYSLLKTSIELPYARYTIRVGYPGYYTNVYKHAQIFAHTTTTQTSTMVPLSEGTKAADREKIFKVPPHPLG